MALVLKSVEVQYIKVMRADIRQTKIWTIKVKVIAMSTYSIFGEFLAEVTGL